MENSFSSFPPLLSRPSVTAAAGTSSVNPPLGCWKDLLRSNVSSSKPFDISYVPPEGGKVSFSDDELEEGEREWELSLVGYAIGRRPFYGTLLAVVKKKWRFMGNLDLLTLEGDFFLFKFSCKEDYDLVMNSGPCFINGKPFVFKKWSWDFNPEKDECESIPIWVKLPNLPLCCWTVKGISRLLA